MTQAKPPGLPDGSDVDEQALRLGQELGRGGEGIVFELSAPFPGVVYKRYLRPAANGIALKRLVDMPATLDAAQRARLLAQTAWPLARVMSRGSIKGYLMQIVPSRFRGQISAGRPRNRELQYLLYEPSPLWGTIAPPPPDGRIAIAREVVALLHLLHSHLLIVGDLSMNNLLWSCEPAAAVFLLDCDGMRRLGTPPVQAQANTPDWDDPERTSRALDLDSDRYKAALVVGRVLSRSSTVRPGQELPLMTGLPEPLAANVRALWRQAARARGSRPDTRQWMLALNGQQTSSAEIS